MPEYTHEPLKVEVIAEHPLLITIRSLDFIGSMEESENNTFAVAFADNCRTEDRGLRAGSRLSGEGEVLLLSEKRLVWRKKIPRPIAAAVSNTGDAAICDIGFGPDLRSSLLVFRQDGSTAVNQVIEANLMSCAIAPDGDFVLFNSLASPNSEHSFKLFAYALPSGEHAFKVEFFTQELTGAVVDGDKVTVKAEGITYQYSRSGALLNKFETHIALFDRNMALGYFLNAHRVLNDSMKEELQSEQRRRLRAAYERLIASDITLNTKAKARRDVGELCLADGDHMQAVREFREALKLNPKIGLKRKLANIEKSAGR